MLYRSTSWARAILPVYQGSKTLYDSDTRLRPYDGLAVAVR